MGIVGVALCCLILHGCGGGGAGAACTAAVGVLGGNACANAANKNNNNTAAAAPLSVSNLQYTVNENQTLNNVLSAANTNNSAVVFKVLTQPTQGTLTLTNSATGAFTYTPNANYHGLDQFTFDITANGQTSNTGVVNISVAQQYIAPIANNLTFHPLSSATYNGTLSGIDLQGYPLTYRLVTGPTLGTLTLQTTGTFSYTPNAGTTYDSFTYLVNDGTANSNIATVQFNVSATTAPTITWVSQGVIAIYNDFTPPNINNVNVQLSATCSNNGPVTYQLGNLPLPPGLTMTSSGQIAGSTTPAPLSTTNYLTYEISAMASCPGSNPTLNTNPIQILVMPPNIIQFGNGVLPTVSGVALCPAGATSVVANCTPTALSMISQGTVGTDIEYFITPPSWLSNFSALIVGGGGGGAAGNTQYYGSGGGAGGYLYYSSIPLTPGNMIATLVGSGGAAGTLTSSAGTGGSSWVAQVTTAPALLSQITAQGGSGGAGPGAAGGAEPGSNAVPPYVTIPYAGGTVVLGQSEGGGGGAEGAGQAPAGGSGAPSNITGTYMTYAKGGSGGSANIAVPTTFPSDGNGGNGGSINNVGVAGDPGVVVIRY